MFLYTNNCPKKKSPLYGIIKKNKILWNAYNQNRKTLKY